MEKLIFLSIKQIEQKRHIFSLEGITLIENTQYEQF